MTSGQDRNAKSRDEEPPRMSAEADEGHELDAEVVRDLELDRQATDVLGGRKLEKPVSY